MFNSKKSNRKQCLSFNTKSDVKIKNKHQQQNLNSSTAEYYDFSDSSLELFDTFKPKSKQKFYAKKNNVKTNDVFDQIDLTNDSDIELNNLKTESEAFKKNKSSDISLTSLINISSNSNNILQPKTNLSSKSNNLNCYDHELGFFDSAAVKNNFDNNDFLFRPNKYNLNYTSKCNQNSNEYGEHQTNYVTPKKQKNIENNDPSESAKLLDRIYGKQWRHIDGVLMETKKKNLNNEYFGDFNKSYNEEISNHTKVKDSFTKNTSHTNEDFQKKDIESKVNDTSIILEKFSLLDDSDDSQSNYDPISSLTCHRGNLKILSEPHSKKQNNGEENTKTKTSKKDKEISYLNQPTSIQIKSDTETKLSFLSSLSCFTGSMKCDPEVEKYKFKFKKNKDELVLVLFELFNKSIFDNKLPADMNFKWNARLRSTAGACFNKRSVKINENLDCVRVSRIELSSKIIVTAERLRDTLIHELCHAACWIVNGTPDGHGASWKSWANKAMQTFPELPIIKRCHSYSIQSKFTYKCKKCGYSFGRHSKSLNLERKRCGYCYGEFELIINKVNNNSNTTSNLPFLHIDPLKELYKLEEPKSKPPRKPSRFALFVKENYSRVKQENPLLKHGEIMKTLGSEFATTKIVTSDEIFDRLL